MNDFTAWFKKATGYVPGCEEIAEKAWNEALQQASELFGDEVSAKRVRRLKTTRTCLKGIHNKERK